VTLPEPSASEGIPRARRCPCGRPSWALVTELALELHDLRERLFSDEVELLAERLARFRHLIDGSVHDMGYHRAIAREVLTRIAKEDEA
jgi:hypothetical protein